MLIFFLWNMCCCDFLCILKKKVGVEYMWAYFKNGNLGFI